MERDEHIGELDDPGRQGNCVAGEAARPAATVPALEQLNEGLGDVRTETHTLGEVAGDDAVLQRRRSQHRRTSTFGSEGRMHRCRPVREELQRAGVGGIDVVAGGAPRQIIADQTASSCESLTQPTHARSPT